MTPTSIPDGSVIITPTEVYQELRATHDTVRDVAQKLDAVVTDHGRALAEHGRDIDDHETRLRSLERNRWPLPAVAALAGLGGLVVSIVQATGH